MQRQCCLGNACVPTMMDLQYSFKPPHKDKEELYTHSGLQSLIQPCVLLCCQVCTVGSNSLHKVYSNLCSCCLIPTGQPWWCVTLCNMVGPTLALRRHLQNNQPKPAFLVPKRIFKCLSSAEKSKQQSWNFTKSS